jgi:Zn-dependent protease
MNNARWTLAFKLGPKFWTLLVKAAKALKIVKVAGFAGSAVAYAWLWSWQFSAVVLFALIVHESGHVWAMRRCGIRTKGFYLIPFVGGAAVATEAINDYQNEFFIVMAGPIFGLASALIPLAIYGLSGHALAAGVAGWIAMLNLINLLPVTPLDGGRIVKAVTFSISERIGFTAVAGGLLMGASLFGMAGAWLFSALLMIGILDLFLMWRKRKEIAFIPQMPAPLVGLLMYLSLAMIFVGILGVTSAVPEAKLALDALKD